jgi:hypothetical protein
VTQAELLPKNATLRSEIHITALAETGVHSFRATNRMNTYQFRRTRTLTLFRRLASPDAPVHGPSSPLDAYPILGRVNRPTRHPPLPHPPLGVRRSRASEQRRVREPETHEPLDDGPRSGPRCGREQSLGQSPGHAHDRAARLEVVAMEGKHLAATGSVEDQHRLKGRTALPQWWVGDRCGYGGALIPRGTAASRVTKSASDREPSCGQVFGPGRARTCNRLLR